MTKRNILETVTVVAITALALTVFVPAASAQQGKTFHFLVPFDFYAGATLMPAGEYTAVLTVAYGPDKIETKEFPFTVGGL